MNRQEFLSMLRKKLYMLRNNDREEAISYYEEIINGYYEDGLSEKEAIIKLGSMDEIIEKILYEYSEDIFEVKNNRHAPNDLAVEFPNSSKKRGLKHLDIPIAKYTNIVFDIRHKKVVVEASFQNECYLKYYNQLKSNFLISHNEDSLYIRENSISNVKIIIRNILFNILFGALFGLFFNNFIENVVIIIILSAFLANLICNIIPLIYRVKKSIDKITLTLPSHYLLNNLEVNSRSGIVRINNIEMNNCTLNLQSGSAKLFNTSANHYDFTVRSGSIKLIESPNKHNNKKTIVKAIASSGCILLQNLNCQDILARCKSGTIKLREIACEQKINLKTTSGSISLKEVKSNQISSIVKSGSILNANVCCEQIYLESLSGSCRAVRLDAKAIYANAKSGSIVLKNIYGTREYYLLDLKSRSGNIKIKEVTQGYKHIVDSVENNIEKRKIKASAISGSIKVSFFDYSTFKEE